MYNDMIAKRVAWGALFFLALSVGSSTAGAEGWPQWRGPNHNGSNDEADLPSQWSVKRDVLWVADMPGTSSATPVVSGNRVFVASNGPEFKKLYGLCLDRETGRELWRKQISDAGKANSRNTMAACSPLADGERVYFLFGTGDLVSLDFDGTEVWSKNLTTEFGPVKTMWGYSSSPLLYKNRLYVTVMRGTRGTDVDSYLMCLEPATGKILWKIHRESDALGESLDAYTTPVPYEANGVSAVVVAGADYITANDAETGEELWRIGDNPRKIRNWRLIPSPVVANDLVCGVVPRGGAVFAVRPSGKTHMELSDAFWTYDERTTDVPTPLFYDGRLYVLNGTRKLLSCLDPATGREIWKGNLEASARIWASPTAGDGKIYFIDEKGQVIVVAAGDTFKVLSHTELGGYPCKSSIAIADNSLFVRTGDKLYRIASKATGD